MIKISKTGRTSLTIPYIQHKEDEEEIIEEESLGQFPLHFQEPFHMMSYRNYLKNQINRWLVIQTFGCGNVDVV